MSLYRVVTYVVRDRPEFGLMPGYVIMGLRKPCPHEYRDWTPDHILKTWPEFYLAVDLGNKKFELRKDDRTPRCIARSATALPLPRHRRRSEAQNLPHPRPTSPQDEVSEVQGDGLSRHLRTGHKSRPESYHEKVTEM